MMNNRSYCYLLYLFCYFFSYAHNKKKKILSIVDPITANYSNDYILLILGIIIILGYILNKHRDKNRFLKKNWNYFFGAFVTNNIFVLLIYNYFNLTFTFKWIYNVEYCFFNVFGLLGALLPLLYLNQLTLLCGLFFFVMILHLLKYLCFSYYVGINAQLLGYGASIALRQWLVLLLLLVVYVVMTALYDIFKLKTIDYKENYSDRKHTTNAMNIVGGEKGSKNLDNPAKMCYDRKIYFDKRIIQEIYGTLSDSLDVRESDLSGELLKILRVFSIKGQIYKVLESYTVTNYFFKPEAGTKMSRIESVEGEVSMELGRTVRVTNSLQGVVFEISNENLKGFSFANLWTPDSKCELPIFLGFDSLGELVILDLTKQPHILLCGTTGSGKSSTLHCIIHSLMTTVSPIYLKFIFIDPKILELSVYRHSKHLFVDIVTDLDRATEVLEKLTKEMENRYKKMSQANQRSINEYNKKVKSSEDILPYLVCVIEEFADLALYKNNNFKGAVQRIAQMGRAAGLHLIIATQRPSVNVIDGVIKANFPTRIGLKVANKMESRIILDRSGAEQMEKPGEMLLLDVSGRVRRVIAPYISEKEIEKLMEFLSNYR